MLRAFSLVELSIVLVILGLLTGGILAGQSLIRAAELRSIVTDFQRYTTAANTFRDKYMATPGDMREATRFWNRQVNAAHCATNITPAATVTTPGVCDGNGNGEVTWPGAASQSGEMFQFWRQLALAGMIEGSYTGLAQSGGAHDSVAGTNVPQSKISNAAFNAYFYGFQIGSPDFYEVNIGNAFLFGGFVLNSSFYAPILKPEDAWGIDTKLDDGKPARGKIIARYWNNLCAAADDGTHASNDLNASYKVSDTTNQCALFFIQAF